jgi:putative membrane protein
MFFSNRANRQLILSLSVLLVGPICMQFACCADSAPGAAPISAQEGVNFIRQAAEIDFAEVTIGKLAEQKAQGAAVKSLAQHIVNDHSKHSDSLKKLAAQHKVDLPKKLEPEHQQLYDKLDKLSGVEFDKEFTHAMVEGHKKAIAFYEAASKNEINENLSSFFKKTIPTLQEHLRMAQKAESELAASENQAPGAATNVSVPEAKEKPKAR